MATSVKWRLKRYGRFIPGKDETTTGEPWKTFEAKKNEPEIILTIVDYGYLMVLHGQQCLETIPLHSASDFLKVHQKSDNLMIRHTIKGASRLIRMQFDGSNKAQAIKECSSAAERLREHVPVGTQDDTLSSNNQPPADDPAPGTQGEAAGGEPEVVHEGSLSIQRLTQHLLGETPLTLPQLYRQASWEHGDLEALLRVCLLDPSFHALVEQVEGELKKILEE
ncbi:meiotic recombination protein REC114 isoform X1 [Nerophis lumbriciformis]|uniref:meiotic recombination protein REC114 isoform X1 n=1 Tax=Nerophis lumbriciformis TaxID=546530 RepID=UPI002AE0763E|nr:meiotic recombination protein REC114-like isoform X1 [Nerophis lumbriciformis]